MPSIAEHLNWHLKQWRHRRLAQGVLATPPIRAADDGVVLFSLVGAPVLLPYLVAVKSLHAALGRGRVVVMDDGSLGPAERAILAEHIGDPRIVAVRDVDTGLCPSGNCWERLLAILDLRERDYVIQLDSDTVTLGPVPEVIAAIDAGRDFTLLGEAEARLLPVADFAATRPPVADPRDPATHVQDASEAVLRQAQLPGLYPLRYVRGCAGFAGFAPGGAGRGLAEGLSREMDRLIGRDAWNRWGAEQVTANFCIANAADPVMLPYDRYCNYDGRQLPSRATFAHFIGTYRFHRSAYLDATRAAIARLSAGGVSGGSA